MACREHVHGVASQEQQMTRQRLKLEHRTLTAESKYQKFKKNPVQAHVLAGKRANCQMPDPQNIQVPRMFVFHKLINIWENSCN